jgi:hypothetical protein
MTWGMKPSCRSKLLDACYWARSGSKENKPHVHGGQVRSAVRASVICITNACDPALSSLTGKCDADVRESIFDKHQRQVLR